MRARERGKEAMDQMRPETVTRLRPDLVRVIAPNPSPMTYWGTNTYVLGSRSVAVIDPGPDDEGHMGAVLGAMPKGAVVSHILVTHAHRDHSAGVARLKDATGAQVWAYGDWKAGRSDAMAALAEGGLAGGGEGVDEGFVPDMCLAGGADVAGDGWALRALWTPGHMGNHLCFAEDASGTVFTGDLVMGWSTSLVSPPDGDLGAFLRSLDRLAARAGDRVYLPGHGGPVEAPLERVAALKAHRLERHRQIRSALAQASGTPRDLAERIYADVAPALLGAAARNVLAHLLEMEAQSEVSGDGASRAEAVFSLR